MADEDDFLSRWSRRKRAVEAEEEVVQAEALPEPVLPEDEEDEQAVLERLGLPLPETMREGDDFSAFMQAGVPQFLRKRALRVLWRSNPVLANLDGLNDYDDDFNSPELTQKVIATGYQVGRGFVKQVLDIGDEDVPSAPEETEELPMSLEEEPDELAGEIKPIEALEPEGDAEEIAAAKPRRMRFET